MTPLQEELIAAVFEGQEATVDRILHAMTGTQRLDAILTMAAFVRLLGRLQLSYLQQGGQPPARPAPRLQ